MPEERRIAFRLALALGWHNPDAMLASMPWRIYQEWLLYAQHEPWDETRADMRMATLAAVMANLWARKKNRRPFTVEEFMPDFGRRAGGATSRRSKTPDELFAIVQLHHASMTGEIVEVPDGDNPDAGQAAGPH